MKKMIALVAVVALSLCAAGASAGEPNLKALGLGGMRPMTAAEGNQVRGMGTAVVSGSSYTFASFAGNSAFHTNAYAATSSQPKALAAGASGSISGVIGGFTFTGPGGTVTAIGGIGAVSLGGAVAYAR